MGAHRGDSDLRMILAYWRGPGFKTQSNVALLAYRHHGRNPSWSRSFGKPSRQKQNWVKGEARLETQNDLHLSLVDVGAGQWGPPCFVELGGEAGVHCFNFVLHLIRNWWEDISQCYWGQQEAVGCCRLCVHKSQWGPPEWHHFNWAPGAHHKALRSVSGHLADKWVPGWGLGFRLVGNDCTCPCIL